MTIKELVTKVALAEGKKLQAHVGNVREVIAILSDMMYLNHSVTDAMLRNGKRRYKIKHKK